VNADKKLGVNPCNDRPITDFVGQDEKDQIRPSQAEFIEKVDIISIASTRGGGGKMLSSMSVLQKIVGITPKPIRPV
jgi:hypothetical protein